MSTALVPTNGTVVEFSQEQVELVKRQIMSGASNDELQLFLATCQRLQLDPFAKQIYAVKRWSRDRGERYETQVSIDGFRVVASRSGDYQGQEGPHWCGPDGIWRDVWLEKAPPAAARVGVWRDGFRQAAWGVAKYDSYVQRGKEGAPLKMWATMPEVMLAKCAESLALRKAFPNDLSGVYTREEMGQAENEAVEVEAVPVAPRSTFTEKVEQAKAVFEGAREVSFPTEGEPDTATSEKLGPILSRIYPGNTEDAQKLKSEWLCRQLGVNKVPKGKTARGIFDQRDLETRCRIIQAAVDYEEMSRPAGWIDGSPPPMETGAMKQEGADG